MMFCLLAYDLSAQPLLKHEQPLKVNTLNVLRANLVCFTRFSHCTAVLCSFCGQNTDVWIRKSRGDPQHFQADCGSCVFFFLIFIQDIWNAGADWNSFAHRCLFLLCCGLWRCNNTLVWFLVGWRSKCSFLFPVNLESKKVTPISVVRSLYASALLYLSAAVLWDHLCRENSLHDVNCCHPLFFQPVFSSNFIYFILFPCLAVYLILPH